MPEIFKFFTVEEDETPIQFWRYTNAKRDVDFGGNIYEAREIKGDKWSRQLRDQENSIDVPASMAPFPLWIPSDPGADLWLEVQSIRRDPGTGDLVGVPEYFGRLLSVQFDFKRNRATLRLSMLSGLMSGDVPSRRYGPFCDWDLFSPRRCDLSPLNFEKLIPAASVTVEAAGLQLVSSLFQTDALGAPISPVDPYWALGRISGNGVERRHIVNHVDDRLFLMTPILQPMQGDYRLRPGCDKSIVTCVNKFNNIEHNSGCARVPRANPSTSRL